jgi:hypothetical protein
MKYLLLIIVVGLVGCERASNENTPKPPFTNIDECVDYVNKVRCKKRLSKKKEGICYS